jgi:response regulator RpfG family c-di-GMP phosphodiesterase
MKNSIQQEKLRVLFVDDDIVKVNELLKKINTTIVEIIPFEPFYNVAETYREIQSQSPDILLMDHGLVQ